MNIATKFSPELRERAVRMVQEGRSQHPSLWKAVTAIAPKIGCNPATLLNGVKRVEIDTVGRPGITTAERERIKALERENKELRRTNEILKLASAFFDLRGLNRLHQLVMHQPGARVAHAQLAHEGQRGDAVLGLTDQIHGLKPHPQWQLGILHDGAGRQRVLVATAPALKQRQTPPANAAARDKYCIYYQYMRFGLIG